MTPAELLEENTRLKKLIKTVSMENHRHTREIKRLREQVIELQEKLSRKSLFKMVPFSLPYGN